MSKENKGLADALANVYTDALKQGLGVGNEEEAPEEPEQIANEGVKQSPYRGYVPLEKRVEKPAVTEEEELRKIKPLYARTKPVVTEEEELRKIKPLYARAIDKIGELLGK